MSPWLFGPPLLFTIVIATLVLSGGPGRADNRAFFTSAILAVLHNIASSYTYSGTPVHPEIAQAITSTLALLWLTAIVHFAYAFPDARRPSPAFSWGLTLSALALGGAKLYTPAALYPFFYIPFALGEIILTLYLLAAANRRLRGEGRNRGIRLVQLALLARLILGAIVHSSNVGLDLNLPALSAVEVAYVPALTSAVIAYALLRYQLLDVRFFISRSLGLFIITALTAVAFVGILEWVQRGFRVMGLAPWGEGALAAPGMVVLLILSFNPVRLRLEAWLEARVNRGLLRAKDAASRYFDKTEGVLNVTQLLMALDEAVQDILPKGAGAIAINRPSPRLIATPGYHWPGDSPSDSPFPEVPFPEGPPAARALHDDGSPFYAIGPGLEDPNLEIFKAWGADLVIPFAIHGGTSGALLCQSQGWEVERAELLVQIGRHLGLQLENALLYEEALDANAQLKASNRSLAEVRNFLEAVLASMPVGLGVLGKGGGLTEMNPAMARILNIDPDAWLGGETLPPVLASLGDPRGFPQTPGSVTPRTLHIQRGDSTEARRVNLRVAPLSDAEGKPRGWVILISDVTDFLRLQDDLEDSRRLAALGTLAAAMAHEIRTPLTSIKLNLQILGGKLLDLPEGDAEYFDIILQELDRLNQYVSEVLDYARPLSLNRSPLKLSGLVDEVRRSLYFLLAEREVECIIEGDDATEPEVEVDGERLKQVLINLIDNASQAMEAQGGGEIKVRVIHQHDDGPWVKLEIIDEGEGMDDDTLKAIFTPFFTTRPTGTGLGLAIATKIVRAHGAKLTVASTPGEGSTFTLWVPRG